MAAAAWFNLKAEKWVRGRRNWSIDLSQKISRKETHFWIHCASAGEFEQAIPLIQAIRQQRQQPRIAVSFFSPSGYELYKNSGIADIFFYLPADTPGNAEKLIELLRPESVLFIRNEIWWNLLTVLKEKSIPTYLVNANLEQKRNLLYKKYLNYTYPLFTKVFDTSTYGNTKLQKVIENKNRIFDDAALEDFCKDSFVIILGSSWKVEESLIALFYKQHLLKYSNLKIIVAPHEYNENKFNDLKETFSDWQVPVIDDVIKYTNFFNTNNKRILFLDKKGILKYAYRYADIAFIGGGFGKSVHNISEAAVYGLPTIFGPNFSKFEDAKDLVNLKVAFPINNFAEFENRLTQLMNDAELRTAISQQLNDHFSQQEKTADKIITAILK